MGAGIHCRCETLLVFRAQVRFNLVGKGFQPGHQAGLSAVFVKLQQKRGRPSQQFFQVFHRKGIRATSIA